MFVTRGGNHQPGGRLEENIKKSTYSRNVFSIQRKRFHRYGQSRLRFERKIEQRLNRGDIRRFSYTIYILISGSSKDIIAIECFAGAETSAPIKRSRIKETCEGVLKNRNSEDEESWWVILTYGDKSNKAINLVFLLKWLGYFM